MRKISREYSFANRGNTIINMTDELHRENMKIRKDITIIQSLYNV